MCLICEFPHFDWWAIDLFHRLIRGISIILTTDISPFTNFAASWSTLTFYRFRNNHFYFDISLVAFFISIDLFSQPINANGHGFFFVNDFRIAFRLCFFRILQNHAFFYIPCWIFNLVYLFIFISSTFISTYPFHFNLKQTSSICKHLSCSFLSYFNFSCFVCTFPCPILFDYSIELRWYLPASLDSLLIWLIFPPVYIQTAETFIIDSFNSFPFNGSYESVSAFSYHILLWYFLPKHNTMRNCEKFDCLSIWKGSFGLRNQANFLDL